MYRYVVHWNQESIFIFYFESGKFTPDKSKVREENFLLLGVTFHQREQILVPWPDSNWPRIFFHNEQSFTSITQCIWWQHKKKPYGASEAPPGKGSGLCWSLMFLQSVPCNFYIHFKMPSPMLEMHNGGLRAAPFTTSGQNIFDSSACFADVALCHVHNSHSILEWVWKSCGTHYHQFTFLFINDFHFQSFTGCQSGGASHHRVSGLTDYPQCGPHSSSIQGYCHSTNLWSVKNGYNLYHRWTLEQQNCKAETTTEQSHNLTDLQHTGYRPQPRFTSEQLSH